MTASVWLTITDHQLCVKHGWAAPHDNVLLRVQGVDSCMLLEELQVVLQG